MCSSFLNDLKITKESSKQVETTTKEQHINPNWEKSKMKVNNDSGQQNLRAKSLELGRSKEIEVLRSNTTYHFKVSRCNH